MPTVNDKGSTTLYEIYSKSVIKTIENYKLAQSQQKKNTTRICKTCQNQTVSIIKQCLIFVQSLHKRHESRGWNLLKSKHKETTTMCSI